MPRDKPSIATHICEQMRGFRKPVADSRGASPGLPSAYPIFLRILFSYGLLTSVSQTLPEQMGAFLRDIHAE